LLVLNDNVMDGKIEFGKQKHYGIVGKKKPTNGKLVLLNNKGAEIDIIMNDQPFALLNSKKSQLIRDGIFYKRQLKVKYL
jgi:hypothetical protein